ncbi:MAG TPA: hypothetical protein VLA43_18005, partial [Longimicrobiales bacterium]|nr:hypothetical protein [Longimicrobiales bacterium]
PATDADVTTLEEMGRRLSRPYHLINANIILTDSEQARFRGRGGDSFLLSSLHCGSSATGWYGTEVFNRSYFSREGMTLATAMAISGAALNPDTGVGGAGVTRGRAASLLLTFLNLRLGFWAPHPRRRRAWFPPNYLTPGLFSGLLGKGLHEDAPFIQLSDGGHFENLGLYELVRRRPRVIVLTDAGADPDFQFADLANAMERVRADFGTRIEFWLDLDLRGVVADQQVDGLGYPVAPRAYAVANIWYGEEGADAEGVHPRRPPDGLLLYIKTTLIDGLSVDLVGYKRANPAFPDESTADQFFSEPQFEAYRELGFQLTHVMVHQENIAYVAKKRREEPPDGDELEA